MVDAYVHIITETGEVSSVAEEIKNIDEIEDMHVVTGDYDIIAQLNLENKEELPTVVANKIHSVSGIIDTLTNVAFSA